MLFAFAVTAQLWNLVAQPLVWPERGEVLARFRRPASERGFRAVFWATIASLILTWLRGLRSYVIDVSRVMYARNVYRVDGRLLTRLCFRSLRNIRFLSPTLASLSLSLSLSRFLFWCPQWATRARLRPFKNMEPVWPEWLLWKSSGLPDGLSPTRGGPPEKRRNTLKKSSF